MRINLCMDTSSSECDEVIMCWSQMLSKEFCVPVGTARFWIYDSASRDFVMEFLNSQGWKVQTYKTPPVNARIVSAGFVVEDPEHLLEAWKLSHK